MNWRVKSLLVTLVGMWLIALAHFISTYWPSSSLIGFLAIPGIFLTMLGALHFCLNTIVESLRKG